MTVLPAVHRETYCNIFLFLTGRKKRQKIKKRKRDGEVYGGGKKGEKGGRAYKKCLKVRKVLVTFFSLSYVEKEKPLRHPPFALIPGAKV